MNRLKKSRRRKVCNYLHSFYLLLQDLYPHLLTVLLIYPQGFNVKSLVQNNVKLNVWDIGGQQSIRPYWRNYYDKTDAVIYVIDSSDDKRLDETGTELSGLLSESKLKGVPLLVFTNKQDLLNAKEGKEIIADLKLRTIIKDRKWATVECSASNAGDTGIERGIRWVVEIIKINARTRR
jgi:ADP-ribosylation factor-like protein 3